MYCKLDTAVIEITRSFESEYNNSPQFEIYTENRYMGTLSLAIASISILIAIGDGTETRSRQPYIICSTIHNWKKRTEITLLGKQYCTLDMGDRNLNF